MMKGIVNTYLNERIRQPSLAAENKVYYETSDQLEIVEIVHGELVDGNNIWFRLSNDTFVSSVGVDVQIPLPDKKKRSENFLYDFQAYINSSIKGNKLITDLAYQDHVFFDSQYLETEGQGVKVGILDSPVNKRHECFNGSIIGSSLVQAEPKHDHGSEMAGLIGGRIRLKGIAPLCIIEELPFHNVRGVPEQDLLISQLSNLEGITHQYILNMSLSIEVVFLFKEKFNAVFENKFIIPVASAGTNDELTRQSIQYPAQDNRVIAVGTITEEWTKENPSPSFNPSIDIIIPDFDYVSCRRKGNEYRKYHGLSDSSATAIVSGLIASFGAKIPNLNTVTAKSLLLSNSVPYADQDKFKYLNLIAP